MLNEMTTTLSHLFYSVYRTASSLGIILGYQSNIAHNLTSQKGNASQTKLRIRPLVDDGIDGAA